MNRPQSVRLGEYPCAAGVTHGLNWVVLGARDAQYACVASMGFGAWLDPFERQRFALLAKRLEARIVIVESPGLGEPVTRLLWRERAALSTGSFTPLAARTLNAAREALISTGSASSSPLHLIGYSMGASLAASMAANPDGGMRVSSLTLVEPVAVRRWRPRSLIAAVRAENTDIDTYLRQNEAVPGAVPPSDRVPGAPTPTTSRLDQSLLAAALCWGQIPATLARTVQTRPNLPVLFLHGSTSALSQPRRIAQLVADLRARGLDVTGHTMPGGHGIWQSLPMVEEMVSPIRAMWRDAP